MTVYTFLLFKCFVSLLLLSVSGHKSHNDHKPNVMPSVGEFLRSSYNVYNSLVVTGWAINGPFLYFGLNLQEEAILNASYFNLVWCSGHTKE
jgi:hypothetical protein